MNSAPINFLMHIFNEDFTACAKIATAHADEDKETIKKYLLLVKEQIDNWIKEL